MSRSLNASDIFAGSEPKFDGHLTKELFLRLLNWYSQNKDSKDSQKWAIDYFKKKLKHSIAISQLKNSPTNFGFICRIVSNGSILETKDQLWFENQIKKIKETKEEIIKESLEVVKPTINIQDRIREKASECIGELNGAIDDFILSGFTANTSPYGIMHTKAIKSVHVSHILNWAKKIRSEFDGVLNSKDDQLKEGYSNFTKPQLKKMVAFGDLIISDAMKISGEALKTRKPRKRKVKSPEELVAKIKVLDKFDELKLVSLPTRDIIGATQLWVYNVKTRKLGCYHAEDAAGFSVKGTSLENFSESKSVHKKLRKPEVSLPEVMIAGKVLLRNYMNSIRAVESALTGRLNSDTILLRILK
jgi:hypothetical protein